MSASTETSQSPSNGAASTNGTNGNANGNGTSNGSSAGGIQINSRTFWQRLQHLIDSWKQGGRAWGQSQAPIGTPQANVATFQSAKPADALLFVTPAASTDDEYSKLIAIQLHLFGYEIPDTAFLFTSNPDTFTVITSQKKAQVLEPLSTSQPNGNKIAFKILISNKSDKNAANNSEIIKLIQSSKNGRRVGILPDRSNDSKTSKGIASQIMPSLTQSKIELIDVSLGLGLVMSVKDASARTNVEKAAEFTTRVLKKYLVPELETIIDEERQVKQTSLADQTDDVLRQPSKVGMNLRADDVDSCYSVILQSGGSDQPYDLRPSAATADTLLNYDSATTIICQLGSRYKSYCSNIGRTYFINPTDDQRDIYALLTQIYVACRTALKPGNKCNQVYQAATRVIQQSKHSDLLSKFTKDCGFGMGLEFREQLWLLNEKNGRTIQKNMIFNLRVGFSDLITTKQTKDGIQPGKSYAVLLSDTMLINDEEPESLTKFPREYKDVAYFLGDDAEEETNKAQNNNNIKNELDLDVNGISTRQSKTRGQQSTEDDEAAREREYHQAELFKSMRENALKKLSSENADNQFNENAENTQGKFQAYDSVVRYPPQARRDRIYVDVQAEAVLFPIHDMLVPFHISTVKNCNKQEEGQYTYLRVNFFTPDAKQLAAMRDDPSVNQLKYVSELTYRTTGSGLDKVFFDIKELRKRVQNRQKEFEAKSSLVAQEDLRLLRSGPVPTLRDISVRPLLSRKRTTGTLTAHINGLRFITTDKMKVDIVYGNIKAAFYQPAEDSALVILHFELINPILLDKTETKKTNYLQFYVEVIDQSEDLNMSNRYRDEDGIMEEQEERRRRKRWNERFLTFVKEVEDLCTKGHQKEQNIPQLEFDIPYRELGFTGVPGKQSVSIFPTVRSLVSLEDIPQPFVLMLDETEIGIFERVQFGLRNFDLVFVFKDFTKLPLRIDSIPINFLEPIKHWLNSCDIVFYETPMNILWKQVMARINEDVEGFWKDGGWATLSSEWQGDDDDEPVEESASEFEPESSEEAQVVSDSEEYETPSDEEDFNSESEAESEEASESEEAEDWDELEEKAKRDDNRRLEKKRARGDSDAEDSDEDTRRHRAQVKKRR